MTKDSNYRLLTIFGLILMVVVSRFIPHPPNFAPVMAMALFGGAVFSDRRLAFIIPFAALLISDIFLGFYSFLPAVYLCYVIVVFIGFSMRNRVTIGKIVLNSFISSIIFFIVTNLAYWLFSGLYTMNLQGLLACYTAAIAFYKYPAFGIETSFLLNSIISTMIYSGVLFGSLSLAERFLPQTRLSPISLSE